MAIKDNLEYVLKQIDVAAKKSGRSSDDITLVAVTKTHEPYEINEIIDAGATIIGENYVQEITQKYDEIKPVKWLFLGHLQTNKVKYIIDKVDMICSVESLKLANEIDKRASAHDLKMDILLQVNITDEETKFGLNPDSVKNLALEIYKSCENINIRGLMYIAPFEFDVNETRPYFRRAKELFDSLKSIENDRISMDYLSMGMSNDYEVAIEEGSNMVRVGTALFGAREYSL